MNSPYQFPFIPESEVAMMLYRRGDMAEIMVVANAVGIEKMDVELLSGCLYQKKQRMGVSQVLDLTGSWGGRRE